jgi:putative transposase
MPLNALGEIMQEEWSGSAVVRSNLKLDAFVIMPNHIHGLITLTEEAPVGATRRIAPTTAVPTRAKRPRGPISGSIGAIIGQFKSLTAKHINNLRGTSGALVWQRNYYEHVIRNDDEMNRAIQYITDNPSRWAEDAENPMRTR